MKGGGCLPCGGGGEDGGEDEEEYMRDTDAALKEAQTMKGMCVGCVWVVSGS